MLSKCLAGLHLLQHDLLNALPWQFWAATTLLHWMRNEHAYLYIKYVFYIDIYLGCIYIPHTLLLTRYEQCSSSSKGPDNFILRYHWTDLDEQNTDKSISKSSLIHQVCSKDFGLMPNALVYINTDKTHTFSTLLARSSQARSCCGPSSSSTI